MAQRFVVKTYTKFPLAGRSGTSHDSRRNTVGDDSDAMNKSLVQLGSVTEGARATEEGVLANGTNHTFGSPGPGLLFSHCWIHLIAGTRNFNP